MSTITIDRASPAVPPRDAGTGFSFVSGWPDALRVLCNLSGLGRKSRLERLLRPRIAERRVTLTGADGESMTVEVAGEGRPLLLIHGLGGSRHDWDATIAPLARTHRVYTLDMRGHGARAAAQARPTLESMAGDIALVLERLGLERPLLVGHSMGALVLMQYLREHGDARIGGACFIDQSPCITTDADWQLGLFGSLTREQLHSAVRRLGADFVETVVAEVLARLSRFGRAEPGLLGRSARALLAWFRDAMGVAPLLSILQSLADSDFRDVVEHLSVPALVVLGGASPHYRGLPLAAYYQAALPHASVTTYAACGHSPHREQPARFASELADFAARLAG